MAVRPVLERFAGDDADRAGPGLGDERMDAATPFALVAIPLELLIF
jgi:hypothetical protein